MASEATQSYLFKVIICGDYAVGKTSLVRRFSTGTFSYDYKTTLAVSFVKTEVSIEGFHIDLSIWDTAGQERFEKMRKEYYKNAKAVIFVYDLTRPESYHHIEKRWKPEVDSAVQGYTTILIGTKADLAEQRVVTTRSGEDLARRIDATYYETSALTGANVEKAFHSLAQLLLTKTLTKPKE
ncbi:MAG: Rab family GTPase [Promethearchaeota archaeon]